MLEFITKARLAQLRDGLPLSLNFMSPVTEPYFMLDALYSIPVSNFNLCIGLKTFSLR